MKAVKPPAQGIWVIVASIIVAMVLDVVILPESLRPWRPEWLSLVLLYWAMALPYRIGIGTAWMSGLLLDVLGGTLLGYNALLQSLVVFLCLQLYKRIRLAPLAQQAMSISGLLLFQHLIAYWILGSIGHAPEGYAHWLSPLTAIILWPMIFTLLRTLRRRYKVS